MEWYFVVLICIGYLAMWTITSILVSKVMCDEEMGPALGFWWPVILPIVTVIYFTEKYG